MKSPAASALPVITFACLGLSGCMIDPPAVPAPPAIAAPAGQVLKLEALASGVQIYECRNTGGSPSQFAWTLKAPEADLYNADGAQVARHYAGPTWEAPDGSKVVGEVKDKSPSPDNKAIPWLLLSATSHSGKGVFAQTASIQRLYTKGGLAPTDGCDPGHVNKTVQVPYTATYKFFNAQQ